MNQDSFIQPLEGCDAVQWQLSEIADEGSKIPSQIREHLGSCAECAEFARLWVEHSGEMISELVLPVREESDPELHRRIMARLASLPEARGTAETIPFPGAVWDNALRNIAAVLALAGFAYWLMNPRLAEHSPPPSAGLSSPVLLQSVAAVERPMKREQQALSHAAAEGGERLHDTIQLSLAMFQK